MDTIDELTIRTRNRRRALDALAGEARAVLTRGKDLQAEVAELSNTIEDLERVSGLLNSLGEERQLKAQTVIEELVTRGLQTIFDDSLSFHIVQSVRARTAVVDFVVRTSLADGVTVDTPVMEARGGGLAATIGFLLRVVVMLLRKDPESENLLVLDETFAHVSEDYLAGVGQFLREIVDKSNIQIILVTHQKEFLEYSDKVYKFSSVNGETKAEVSHD
jgi:DNA repair exonuclease SbcCD ATPase subunit